MKSDGFAAIQLTSVHRLIFEAVKAGGTLGVTDEMCSNVVRAAYPDTDAEDVRVELDHLESAGMVKLERSADKRWRVELTKQGRDVVDYVADAPDGILRPALA